MNEKGDDNIAHILLLNILNSPHQHKDAIENIIWLVFYQKLRYKKPEVFLSDLHKFKFLSKLNSKDKNRV